MQEEEDFTLFDIKFSEAMERFDSLFLLAAETNSVSVKNYIDFYRLDKSQEKQKSINKVKSKNKNEVKSNQIPRYVINIQEKKEKQYYNNKYLKNEIDWYEIKKKSNEMRIKFNNHLNKQKFENNLFQNKIPKEIEKNNKIIKKNFSNLSNKLNIEKLINKKNENRINDNIMKDIFTLNSHKTNNNNRYGQLKLYNKNGINNKIGNNINVNYSEDIKKKLKLKSNIDNFISQNINSNNIKKIKIKNTGNSKSAERVSNINPLDNKIYRLTKIEVNKHENEDNNN